jgi:hypothetical protein
MWAGMQVYRVICIPSQTVVAGLVPAIHGPRSGAKKGVDHRDEPGDDEAVRLWATLHSHAELAA